MTRVTTVVSSGEPSPMTDSSGSQISTSAVTLRPVASATSISGGRDTTPRYGYGNRRVVVRKVYPMSTGVDRHGRLPSTTGE